MSESNIEWRGLEEIRNTLNKLPDLKSQNKAIVSAFRSASKPTQTSLENNSPYDTGNLSRSMGFSKGKGSIIDYGKVGSLRRKGGFHGHLLNDGTNQRRTKDGWNTGKLNATNFFKKSWENNIQIMRNIIGVRISKIVENHFKKIHKNR